MKPAALLCLLLLTACATPTETVWRKDGAGRQDFNMDTGQCRAAAAGASPYMVPMQMAIIYSNCMQGKGWYTVEIPAR